MIKKNCIGRNYYNVINYFAGYHPILNNSSAYLIAVIESLYSLRIQKNYLGYFFDFLFFPRNLVELFNKKRIHFSNSFKNFRFEHFNENTLVEFLNPNNSKNIFQLTINLLILKLQYFQFYLGLVREFIMVLYIESTTLIKTLKRKFKYYKTSILVCSIDFLYINLFLPISYLSVYFSIALKFELIKNNNIKLKLMTTSDKITPSFRSELELGRTLFQIRNKKKISLNQLSKLTKISHSYLSEIENDKKVPNIHKLDTICNALDVPMIIVLYLSKNKNLIQDQFKKQVFESVSSDINTLIDVLY